jgi:ribosomal protein S13
MQTETAVSPASSSPVYQTFDDLTRIKGIGATTASDLARIGITSFEQIANWTEDDIDLVHEKIHSPRIRSDDWRGSAIRLYTEKMRPKSVRAEAPGPATGVVRKRLNRHKSFSEIVGVHHGAMYQQGGRDFDHAGIEIFGDDDDGEGPVEPEFVAGVEDVNFINWLDKKVEYPADPDPAKTPPLVRAAIKRQFRKDLGVKREAQKFLHEMLRGNR